MNLDTHGIVGPITALCVYRNRLFAGCGSEVQIYSTETCDFLASFPVFSSATVHGLVLGPEVDSQKYLCVFGAKCSRVLALEAECSDSEDQQKTDHARLNAASAVREFEDWIWAAAWLQEPGKAGQCSLALALAHNVVLHWSWQTDTILHRATCVEKCILKVALTSTSYCGHFIGQQWSELVLAAGTVFNQVVLWSPAADDHRDPGSAEPSGPRPVLQRLTGHKGVIFSIFYHRGLQRLCSVSDDRSIIMYQLHFPPPSRKSSADAGTVSEDWNCVRAEPMLTAFGHSGRVWDVVLLKDCFISVGEDAHCIVWDYSGEVLQKHTGHKGQNIWSLAASEEETFVVTGGGDCSIRKWRLCANRDLALTQNHLTTPHHVKTCADDFVRTLVLWGCDHVVLMTNAGSTLCYNIPRDSWEILVHDADFASYATLAVSTDRAFLAIGSISGHARVICKDPGSERGVCDTKVQVHSGKVCGLTWVSQDHFLTTGLHGHCTESALQPSQTFAKIHGGAGVTCVCLYDGTVYTAGRDGHYRRWSLTSGRLQLLNSSRAGRDGYYRRWSLTSEGDEGGLKLLKSSRAFKGCEWIGRLWIGDHGLFILGFYSSKFVLWEAGQGERHLEVDCGGGHRSWDCVAQRGGQEYRFCYVKAREVIVVNGGRRAAQDVVKPPLHGKKVWGMKCLSTQTDRTGMVQHVVCTGSEDTTLSLGLLCSHYQQGEAVCSGEVNTRFTVICPAYAPWLPSGQVTALPRSDLVAKMKTMQVLTPAPLTSLFTPLFTPLTSLIISVEKEARCQTVMGQAVWCFQQEGAPRSKPGEWRWRSKAHTLSRKPRRGESAAAAVLSWTLLTLLLWRLNR
ncbi:hypothetical protein ACOMHN_022990 [Nucella lapillus]